MSKRLLLLTGFAVFSGSLFSQQNASDYSSELVRSYIDQLKVMIPGTPGFTPPVTSRALGYTGLALFEAVQPGIGAYESLEGRVNGLEDIPDPSGDLYWPAVANSALSTIIDSLFFNTTQQLKDDLHALRDEWSASFSGEAEPAVLTSSEAFGVSVAQAVFAYSQTDGGHEGQLSNFPATYTPPAGPGLWAPVGSQVALQPYWGENRKFAEENEADALMPNNIPDFSTDPSSLFYFYANQVYETGNNLTQEQEDIALWWADGSGSITPPGHSISLLGHVLQSTNADLEKATIAFAQLGMSLSDAFSVCWKTKFIYNNERPITYIQEHIDPSWSPLIGTPPFPDYISGHSTQSGAMATILTDLFGDNFAFVDQTHGLSFGGPREFSSFWEAAQEAAVSRLYGGIHWQYSNFDGLNCGQAVAQSIQELFEGAFVGVSENAPLAEVELYPNPAADFMRVRVPAQETFQSTIYSTSGQLVYRSSNERTLDLQALQAGTYIIEIRTGAGNVARSPFIKI